jgi:hypothetical protein
VGLSFSTAKTASSSPTTRISGKVCKKERRLGLRALRETSGGHASRRLG